MSQTACVSAYSESPDIASMGSCISFQCSCGYEGTAMVGCGMQTVLTQRLFPYQCTKCRAVISANALKPRPTCPKCRSADITSYGDSSLTAERGEQTLERIDLKGLINERETITPLELHNGRYHCPSCKENNLRFLGTLFLWD